MTPGMLSGDRVMRISWQPGEDTLIGTCHCGATRQEQEPVAMWDWLLAHPVGHRSRYAEVGDLPWVPSRIPVPA